MPSCWTRAPTCARCPRCTGCSSRRAGSRNDGAWRGTLRVFPHSSPPQRARCTAEYHQAGRPDQGPALRRPRDDRHLLPLHRRRPRGQSASSLPSRWALSVVGVRRCVPPARCVLPGAEPACGGYCAPAAPPVLRPCQRGWRKVGAATDAVVEPRLWCRRRSLPGDSARWPTMPCGSRRRPRRRSSLADGGHAGAPAVGGSPPAPSAGHSGGPRRVLGPARRGLAFRRSSHRLSQDLPR